MLDDIRICTCEEVEPGVLMKWNENCLEHGTAAQYFERERQHYLCQIKAMKSAQHSVVLTAFGAFLTGVLVGSVIASIIIPVLFGGG